jgi:hypothetical protein
LSEIKVQFETWPKGEVWWKNGEKKFLAGFVRAVRNERDNERRPGLIRTSFFNSEIDD